MDSMYVVQVPSHAVLARVLVLYNLIYFVTSMTKAYAYGDYVIYVPVFRCRVVFRNLLLLHLHLPKITKC